MTAAAATERTPSEQFQRFASQPGRRGSVSVISNCALHSEAERLWLMRRQRNETSTLRRMWKETQRQFFAPSLPQSGESPPSQGQVLLTTELPTITNPRDNCVIENRLKHLRDIDSAKYYTALTRRTKKEPTEQYMALTSRWAPLPRLFGAETAPRVSKSLDSWKKEIVKDVSPRPLYTVESAAPVVKQKEVSSSNDDLGLGTLKQSHFYQATHGKVPRHYTVNPEWTSERMTAREEMAARQKNFTFAAE